MAEIECCRHDYTKLVQSVFITLIAVVIMSCCFYYKVKRAAEHIQPTFWMLFQKTPIHFHCRKFYCFISTRIWLTPLIVNIININTYAKEHHQYNTCVVSTLSGVSIIKSDMVQFIILMLFNSYSRVIYMKQRLQCINIIFVYPQQRKFISRV